MICCALFLCVLLKIVKPLEQIEVNLPPDHIPFYFASHKNEAEACAKSSACQFKKYLNTGQCWGYEKNCSQVRRYSNPICSQSSKGWVKSKSEQLEKFYVQGDFGYIREQINEITVLCDSEHKNGSFFECSHFMRFCRGRNIFFDFKTLETISQPMRYREDVIREGQVGGYCKLKKKLFKKQGEHKSPLQSWYAEFEHFTELQDSIDAPNFCDIIISKPTFIMKLDAPVNMYHHFCDFLNLYSSLHVNQTFSTDVNVLVWDMIPYRSNFEIVWKAFTRHPIMDLGEFTGKKVCFKDAVFPLLPRMIFGMYYNMPLIPGCQGSGLFKAFKDHLKYSLKIKDIYQGSNVRVTLISRSTQYRRILNEDELIASVKSIPNVVVKAVNFNGHMPFQQQLEVSYNTDILIGIHGAGLTHMLFMPEWGAVFEIFNCDDENCYADLARLKGLKYLTWEKRDKLHPEDEGHHPTLGAHAKFTNYAFDAKEFKRLFKIALNHVRNHNEFPNKHSSCEGSHCGESQSHTEL